METNGGSRFIRTENNVLNGSSTIADVIETRTGVGQGRTSVDPINLDFYSQYRGIITVNGAVEIAVGRFRNPGRTVGGKGDTCVVGDASVFSLVRRVRLGECEVIIFQLKGNRFFHGSSSVDVN